MQQRRILFCNQHYHPDVAATALALTDLCEFLATRNMEVHVIASRGAYDSKEREKSYEVLNGVHIHRVAATSFGRKSNLFRMVDYGTFFLLAILKSLFMRRFQVVVTLTTPPLLTLMGTVLGWIKRSRHVIWSMDLHPEAEIAAGMTSESSLIAKILLKLNGISVRRTERIVALSPDMRKRLLRYQYPEGHIDWIRIWSDQDEVKPMERALVKSAIPEPFRERFIVNYSGNMGLAHEFETMKSALLAFKNRHDIGFIFGGGGPKKAMLETFAAEHQLTNVAFLPYMDRSEINMALGRGHINWLSLSPEFVGIASPSKAYGYMASGRPIVFVGEPDSDIARDIAEADCGYAVKIGDTDGLVKAIETLKDSAELRSKLAANGRRFFEVNASKNVGCQAWLKVIEDAIGA